MRRWLRAKGDAAALSRYEQGLRRDDKILALLKQTRARLKTLYEKKDTLSVDELRQAKARELDLARHEYTAMKERGESDSTRDGWFGKQFNNARLASIATYHDLVPGFTRMLRDSCGNLEKFYKEVAVMKSLNKDERRQRLVARQP